MRKIIFCLLCLMACLNIYVVGAVEESGHPEFQEITIPKGSKAKLINSIDQSIIKKAYSNLKRKFWGWSVDVIINNEKIEYKGDTVFSKKNNTSQTLKYTYTKENEQSITTSISASGSITGKGSGKIKGVTASLDAMIRGEIGKKTVISYLEKTVIDINMGCPVPKVAVKSQAGAGLLKHPDKIKEIVHAVVEAVPCPVTVKIRSGWDKNSINAVEVAKIIEEAGASAITVHPRTRSDGYEGQADWNIIKEVKENVSIPVIGNGDIKTPEDAKRMIDETNCDGVMIGRAALGNPYLFKQVIEYLETGNLLPDLTPVEKIDLALKHLEYLSEIKPEKTAVLEMRTHAAWYIKGLNGSTEIKREIFKCQNKAELVKILEEYKKKI